MGVARFILAIMVTTVTAGVVIAAPSPCERGYRFLHYQRHPEHNVIEETTPDERWMLAILQEAGCKTDVVMSPTWWTPDRVHVSLREGKLDVRAQASYLPERAAYAYFSQPYRTERVWLYTLAQQAALLDGLRLNDFSARKLPLLMLVQGWFGPEAETLRTELSAAGLLIEYKDMEQAHVQLLTRRADVLLASDSFGQLLLDRNVPLVHQQVPVYEDPVHLMLSRVTHEPADVERINAAIQRLLMKKFRP